MRVTLLPGKQQIHKANLSCRIKGDPIFRISVRGGTNFNDLQEIEVENISQIEKIVMNLVQVVDLNEPAGWIVIPLKDINERLVRKGQ